MAGATAAERRVLTAAEYELVARSYTPALNALKRQDLVALVAWLRRQSAKWRGKERRSGTRPAKAVVSRSKASSGPGQAVKEKAFAGALTRAAKRLERIVAEEKRAAMKARMAEALERKRAAKTPEHPSGGRRSGTGARPIESRKTKVIVKGSRIGSTSQATRNAQARRDNRGKK